jgi:hypothetical protein
VTRSDIVWSQSIKSDDYFFFRFFKDKFLKYYLLFLN